MNLDNKLVRSKVYWHKLYQGTKLATISLIEMEFSDHWQYREVDMDTGKEDIRFTRQNYQECLQKERSADMFKRTVTQRASDLVHEIQDMVINNYFASHLTDTLTDEIIRLCHEFDEPSRVACSLCGSTGGEFIKSKKLGRVCQPCYARCCKDEMTDQSLGPVGKLLSDPSRWTKGVLARDIAGEPVDPKHSGAGSWCLVGAIEKEYKECQAGSFEAVIDKVREAIMARSGICWIVEFNDHNATHEDIMAVCRETGI